uniref:NRF domain-containing protein n=2 Tax=Onchocerca ochengi TaxID=42157 RepID=A0A182EHJ7_ONCOC
METLIRLIHTNTKMDQLMHDIDETDIVEVIDASAKVPPSGILRGHVIVFGQFEECMLARQQLPNSSRVITGSYVRIFVDKKLRNYNVKGACKLNQYSIGDPSFDVCLPSSCDQHQTLMTLSRSLIQSNGSTPVCTVKQASVRFRPIDYKTWTVLAVMALIGAIAILATTWDLFTIYFESHYHKLELYESAQWFRCLMAFSLIRNTKDIFNIEPTNKPGQIGPIHFMRFISMVWVIFGHATASYMLFSCKLSPPYYIVIAFYSFVFKSLLVNMPLILITVDDHCEKSWWTNFLYLNNFIHYSNQCYLVSWYLATDFQLHIFAPVLLIPLALKPMLGYIIAGLLIMFSTVANLVTVYKGYFPPTDFFMGVMDPRMGSYKFYSLLIYQAPWIRCQVYIVGILVGYLFQTRKTLHISKPTNIICWIISVIFGLLLIMSLRDWIGYDIVMNLSLRAFYSAFSKLAWSLALAYITIACFYNYGGPINDFMSLPIWKPLGRLTYCTYLTHLTVLLYMLCMGVNAFSFSSITHTFFVFTLPCCILSWFFAYWLSVLFELPASNLEMIFLDKFREKSLQKQMSSEMQAVEQNHPIINGWKNKIEGKAQQKSCTPQFRNRKKLVWPIGLAVMYQDATWNICAILKKQSLAVIGLIAQVVAAVEIFLNKRPFFRGFVGVEEIDEKETFVAGEVEEDLIRARSEVVEEAFVVAEVVEENPIVTVVVGEVVKDLVAAVVVGVVLEEDSVVTVDVGEIVEDSVTAGVGVVEEDLVFAVFVGEDLVVTVVVEEDSLVPVVVREVAEEDSVVT